MILKFCSSATTISRLLHIEFLKHVYSHQWTKQNLSLTSECTPDYHVNISHRFLVPRFPSVQGYGNFKADSRLLVEN